MSAAGGGSLVISCVSQSPYAVSNASCAGKVVEHLEPRVEARLDRALAQQPRRERVDRLDVRVVEPAERLVEARARRIVFGVEHRVVAGRGGRAPTSSAAAFSVNVITATCCIFACPCAMIRTMRSTSTVVLPVPAPASTHMFEVDALADALAHGFVLRLEVRCHSISLIAR